MNAYELQDALVEFIQQNTFELKRFRYDETLPDVIVPNVFSGFVPRNVVGEIDPTGVKRYPAIIVGIRGGDSDTSNPWESELATVNIVVGTFDDTKDEQGYLDALLLVNRIDDRIREESILRERFALQMPLKWVINRHNTHPYWFGELTILFSLPVMTSQFAPNAYTGDTLGGTYNERARPDTTERPTPYLDRSNNR
jgi:hypothetical protein